MRAVSALSLVVLVSMVFCRRADDPWAAEEALVALPVPVAAKASNPTGVNVCFQTPFSYSPVCVIRKREVSIIRAVRGTNMKQPTGGVAFLVKKIDTVIVNLEKSFSDIPFCLFYFLNIIFR